MCIESSLGETVHGRIHSPGEASRPGRMDGRGEESFLVLGAVASAVEQKWPEEIYALVDMAKTTWSWRRLRREGKSCIQPLLTLVDPVRKGEANETGSFGGQES